MSVLTDAENFAFRESERIINKRETKCRKSCEISAAIRCRVKRASHPWRCRLLNKFDEDDDDGRIAWHENNLIPRRYDAGIKPHENDVGNLECLCMP